MKIDFTKLQDAVGKVASLAASHAELSKTHADILADHKANQDAVDALTASLLAAVNSPAEAVGVTAVAAAVHPDALATDPAIAPHVIAPAAPEAAVVAAHVDAPAVAPAVAPEAPATPQS